MLAPSVNAINTVMAFDYDLKMMMAFKVQKIEKEKLI